MKAEVIIPDGYLRLGPKEIIKRGDRYFSHKFRWEPFSISIGETVRGLLGIRRITPAKSKGKSK